MDVSRYARFLRPGHARHRRPLAALTRLDAARDAGRLRLRARDRRRPLAARLRRAPRRRASARPSPASSSARSPSSPSTGSRAKRLMTDNAFSYVKNRSLRELLARRGIRHLTTQPYRPRTNGKVERFHQTMAREWAYGLAYRSHRHRNQAPCHTGSTTTTGAGHTAHSETGHRSAAFTTSVGRTTKRPEPGADAVIGCVAAAPHRLAHESPRGPKPFGLVKVRPERSGLEQYPGRPHALAGVDASSPEGQNGGDSRCCCGRHGRSCPGAAAGRRI